MNTTHVPSESVVQKYSAFFLLDFISRYAVDRCGAEDSLITAFLSWVCVLPFWIWMCSLFLMLTKVEFYWAMAKYTITLLTLCTVALLFVFDTTPPVLGCGPDQSFPSPQATLSAYGATTFFYYASLRQIRISYWLHLFVSFNLVAVTLGLLWIGMASPTSIVAGTGLGSCVAALLHEVLLNLGEHPGKMTQFILFLEEKLGIHTVDTILSSVGYIAQHKKEYDVIYGSNQTDDQTDGQTELSHANSQNSNMKRFTPLPEAIPELAHPQWQVVNLDNSIKPI